MHSPSDHCARSHAVAPGLCHCVVLWGENEEVGSGPRRLGRNRPAKAYIRFTFWRAGLANMFGFPAAVQPAHVSCGPIVDVDDAALVRGPCLDVPRHQGTLDYANDAPEDTDDPEDFFVMDPNVRKGKGIFESSTDGEDDGDGETRTSAWPSWFGGPRDRSQKGRVRGQWDAVRRYFSIVRRRKRDWNETLKWYDMTEFPEDATKME